MARSEKRVVKIGSRSEDGATLKLVTTPAGLQRLEFAAQHTPFDAAAMFGQATGGPKLQTHTLADYNPESGLLRTFPIVTRVGSTYFLERKYRIAMLAVEGQPSLSEQLGETDPARLEALPSGFVRDPFEGLGLVYPLRFIIESFDQIEALRGVVLTKGPNLRIADGVAQIPLEHFHKVRKAINRAHEEALNFAAEDKTAYLNTEILARLVPNAREDTFRKPVQVLRESVQDALVKPGKRQRETANAEAAIRTVRRSIGALASDAPVELYRLNRTIESVALADLVAAFEQKLVAKLTEKHWQNFLTHNPFILRLAFGFPIAIFGEQVSVGGGTFNGSGGKLADYVVKSGLLGNVSLVEIKKPGTHLVERKPYRGGVHAPTKELSGAVNQILDQRYHLQSEIGSKKLNSGVFDVFAYAVQCIVIAGIVPPTNDTRKSFELYRSNLHDVIVITFDELLAKLKALDRFLSDSRDDDTIAPRLLGDAEDGQSCYIDYEEDEIEDDLEED